MIDPPLAFWEIVARFLGAALVLGGLGYAIYRASKADKVRKADEAKAVQQRNELALSRDPRPAKKRDDKACLYCNNRATHQMPQYSFHTKLSLFDLLRGIDSRPRVQTVFDKFEYPFVLCPTCASITESALDAELASAESTLVTTLSQFADVTLRARIHGALEPVRKIQDSFAKGFV